MIKDICLLLLVTATLSCKDMHNSKIENTVYLSNVALALPDSLTYTLLEGEIALARIDGKVLPAIMVYNFGNKPISLAANVARWKSQLTKVHSEVTTTYHDGLIYETILEGSDIQGEKVVVFAAIIPSENGPYYLKSTVSQKYKAHSKNVFSQILKNISYKD